ncbi:hypothetical protein ABZX74_15320 [Streptomyces olivaceoviridis]|uniref:hypothetical protein n=1 Tax=Streptomyces olivaceoviridis TaxID=1921 RepID=UPI0033A00927
MSRLAKRPRANHKQTAEALRQQPGVWLVVGDYRNSISADNLARRIRYGYPIGNPDDSTPYHPAGAYETRTELVEDGTRVHARYTGGAA